MKVIPNIPLKITVNVFPIFIVILTSIFLNGCAIPEDNKTNDNIIAETPDKVDTETKLDELNTESLRLYALSRQYAAEGRNKQALEILWEIPPASTIFESACLDMINIAITLDDTYSVLYGARRYLQINPLDTSVMFIYAEYLYRQGIHIAKAEKILNKLLTITQQIKAYELLAKLQLLKTEFSAAEQTINQLYAILSKEEKKPAIEYQIMMAKAKAGQNLIDDAGAILDKILSSMPENREALIVYLSILKDNEAWLRLVNSYLEKNNEDIEIIKLSGDFFYKNGNYETASVFFAKAVVLSKDDLFFQRRLAECYMMLGDYKKAVSTFQKLRKYLPDDENLKASMNAAYVSLINKLKQDENWSEAEQYLKLFSWANPEKSELLFEISEIQEKQGNLIRARVTLENLIDKIEDIRRVYQGIVRISLKLGDEETAFRLLDKILKINPQKSDVIQYVQIANKTKKFKNAYNALKLVYLETFKDKELFELYRNATFRLLKIDELNEILEGSQAKWVDSNDAFIIWARELCINELKTLKKNNFSISRRELGETEFSPYTIALPKFFTKNTVILTTQDLSGPKIDDDKDVKTSEIYPSKEITTGLKLGELLYNMLINLDAAPEIFEYWEIFLDVYKLILRTDFAGTSTEISPLQTQFLRIFKFNFQKVENSQLHDLRIMLLLKAHKKSGFLKDLTFSKIFLEDLAFVGINEMTAINAVVALTDCACEFPDMSLDAIEYAIRSTFIITGGKIELPAKWQQVGSTQVDVDRFPETCFNRIKQTSLAGKFYPEFYTKLLDSVNETKDTDVYTQLYRQLKNLLEFEDRKPSRAVLYEILATCQLGKNQILSASFYMQSAVFELSTSQTSKLDDENIKMLNKRIFELYTRLGSIQMKLGDPNAAIEYYKRILNNRPDFAKAYTLIIEALKDAERTTEIDNYIYQYLVNITDAKDFRTWWNKMAESIGYEKLLERYRNDEFKILRIQLTQLLTNYPDLYVLSFLLADCLESLGESWESEELRDKTIKSMPLNLSKGLVLPVTIYVYKTENWQIFGEITEICNKALLSEPEYNIVKARVDIFNEEFSSADTNIKKADELLENLKEMDYFESLKTLWLLEKIRHSIKVVTPESAIAILNSVAVESRLKIKKQLLSDNDFQPLWLSNIFYNLMRCNNPVSFEGELVNGTKINGEKYYEDDKKVHIKLPDGKYTIINKDSLKKE